MEFQTLIDVNSLRNLLDRPGVAVLDCRFDLMNPEAGRDAYSRGHIPGARHVDLNRDLSVPPTPHTGRHPLPEPGAFARRLGELGVDNDTQVVAYDDANGSFAARLWWMLRWLGHTRVAVLDGGFKAWVADGGALELGNADSRNVDSGGASSGGAGSDDARVGDPYSDDASSDGAPSGGLGAGSARPEATGSDDAGVAAANTDPAGRGSRRAAPATAHFVPHVDEGALVNAAEVIEALRDRGAVLVDARAPERFAGSVEPMDPIAGHVPGAENHPFTLNLDASAHFLPAAELRRRWQERLAGRAPADLIAMCGSGVTACHNLLSLEAAGLGGGRLYAGSWSEWIRDPARPVARG